MYSLSSTHRLDGKILGTRILTSRRVHLVGKIHSEFHALNIIGTYTDNTYRNCLRKQKN